MRRCGARTKAECLSWQKPLVVGRPFSNLVDAAPGLAEAGKASADSPAYLTPPRIWPNPSQSWSIPPLIWQKVCSNPLNARPNTATSRAAAYAHIACVLLTEARGTLGRSRTPFSVAVRA